jgi:hypothetical protein
LKEKGENAINRQSKNNIKNASSMEDEMRWDDGD